MAVKTAVRATHDPTQAHCLGMSMPPWRWPNVAAAWRHRRRCSAPMLNYRHRGVATRSARRTEQAWQGMQTLTKQWAHQLPAQA